MIVRVKLFAAAKQFARRDVAEVELAEGATVGDLRLRLAEAIPEMADLLHHVLFAIDSEYAGDSVKIPVEADVACIPPVSGG